MGSYSEIWILPGVGKNQGDFVFSRLKPRWKSGTSLRETSHFKLSYVHGITAAEHRNASSSNSSWPWRILQVVRQVLLCQSFSILLLLIRTVGNYLLIVSFFLCKTWHHGNCVGITEKDGEELQEFYCDMCAAWLCTDMICVQLDYARFER